jgi:hypothetical protein
MTASSFGWLAHDDGERRRMMEVINLFREKGTLDELGIGTIRDTFADHFFPGTSTIQTRARYFLFIPWMYQQIEEERVPSPRAGRRARELHTLLVASLKKGGVGANAGLIGIDAGDALQRLPSAIYWYGLGRWGIRLFPGSTDRYHASLDAHYREERAAKTSDGGELINPARRNWLPSIPPRPQGFLDTTTFDLTATEADFLIERVRRSAPDSLLAACLTPQVTRKASAKAPWDLGTDALPKRLRDDIEHARLFSLVMEGAALLYNRLLAEASAAHFAPADTARVDRYGAVLGRWAADMAADSEALAAWNQEDLWGRLTELDPGIPFKAREFSRQWIERACLSSATVMDDPAACELIRYRERQTKGGLARLHNDRALERWSGASSLGRLTYRWDQAKGIVSDILRGAQQPLELP